MNYTIPVTFQNPESNDSPYTLDCEVVFGQAANEIIIKSILPDERPQECRSEKDRFGIPVVADENFTPFTLQSIEAHEKLQKMLELPNNWKFGLLTHLKIVAITILESWCEPSKIPKLSDHMTDAVAWLIYYSGSCVSIELVDGIMLRGNIEPRLKEKREQIGKKELSELSEFSKLQTRELKNAQEQLLIGFAKNLSILIKCINSDEMQLIYDYTECNGVFNQIATKRKNRG